METRRTAFRSAFPVAAEKIGHPLVFEPEGGPNYEDVSWNLMGWGYYSYPFIPMVDKYKWLETRHMVNVCDRWNKDQTSNLQYAFFNGEGLESWENIWGIWNGINPRDAEATRRVAAIEHGVAPSWSVPIGSRSIPWITTASTPAAGRWAARRFGPSSTATAITLPGGR